MGGELARADALALPDIAEIKAEFVAAFGADPARWEEFQRHVELTASGDYHTTPVTPRVFFTDPYYCGKDLAGTLFPEVLKALEETCSGEYVEAVLTGGIGVSKTTIALLGTMYQVYLLSCMYNPLKTYGLMASDEIVFIFQSMAAHLARDVDFERFKNRIEASEYFKTKFPFDKDKESQLHFPNRVIVKPVSGAATAAISQNVFGGIIDEVNFMAVIQKSARSVDGSTSYDQAQALYDSIRRRRESRFMQLGKTPGLLYLVSSKRYPGQFTDRKAEEARREIQATGRTRIYIYDKVIWQVQPDKFGPARFKVFVGDMSRQPYVMTGKEDLGLEDAHLVLDVPEEYRMSFETDILGALRDIGGTSTLALSPFILDTGKVSACFGTTASVLSRESCDFKATTLQIYPDLFEDRDEPRAVHIDLAIRGDSAGVACGYIKGFEKYLREDGIWEVLPIVKYDFVLEVPPPKGEEIIFAKIRSLIVKLRELGLNIKWVTLDSFQSRDTIQIMRTMGFQTGLQSMDITPMPHTLMKAAFLDKRVRAPKHPRAQGEFAQLEQDQKTGKIDHPPNGSKDCADAMTGVCFTLFMRRELWARHGVASMMPKDFVTAPKEIDKPAEKQAGAG